MFANIILLQRHIQFLTPKGRTKYAVRNIGCFKHLWRASLMAVVLLAAGALSPSSGSGTAAMVSCLTPGLRFSKEKGNRTPSVDSSISVGAGGNLFLSAEDARSDFTTNKQAVAVTTCLQNRVHELVKSQKLFKSNTTYINNINKQGCLINQN